MTTKPTIKKKQEIPLTIPTGSTAPMVDVHAVQDIRGIKINRVGVNDVKFPMLLRSKTGEHQTVHASFDMYVSLIKSVKGVNMSRFVEELLENWKVNPISGDMFYPLVKSLQRKLESDDAYISTSFNYFVPKVTPVTKRPHLSSHECRFIGQIIKNQYFFTVETNVLVASSCPCSKEMCLTDKEKGIGKGAHEQRGQITLQVRTNPPQPGIWIEDMINLSESCGSAQLYPLLKRPDEKFVTEQAYGNPKYVEDIARDVVVKVKELSAVQWARVRVTNFESIHPHNVQAIVEVSKKGGRWYATNKGKV